MKILYILGAIAFLISLFAGNIQAMIDTAIITIPVVVILAVVVHFLQKYGKKKIF